MSRKPRIHNEGAYYHVMLRGNARQDVFFDDDDRYRLFLFIQEGIERFGYRVHCYCLMTNHIHLVIQVAETPLSRVMQSLCSRYTRWVNWRHNRIGHLFHGRYKAIMIDADSYLTQLVGYIHLNPVRARMVGKVEDYEWSSHRSYIGDYHIPWLTIETVLTQFSGTLTKARKLFREFVETQKDEGHRGDFYGEGALDSRVIGEDRFVDEVLFKAGALQQKPAGIETVLKAIEHVYGIQVALLAKPGQDRMLSEARSMSAWGVNEMTSATLTELSNLVSRDVTSLSSGGKRMQLRAKVDLGLAGRMARFKEMVVELAKLQS
jgi:REP element-mobilizing transposase RayT